MVRVEDLHKFYMLSSEVGSTTSENLKNNNLGLGMYLFPANGLSKKKCTMHCRINNPRGLKVRHYDACMIYSNNNCFVLPGSKEKDICFETELNEILFNIMPTICIRLAYMQGSIFLNHYFKNV